MSDLPKELQDQKEQNINLRAEIRELHTQVRKWSTLCAYVSGISIGSILFVLLFQGLFSADKDCPEPEACEECPIEKACDPSTQIIENSNPNIKEVPSIPKQSQPKYQEIEEKRAEQTEQIKPAETMTEQIRQPQREDAEYNFPMKYTIKSGDNFSIIANRFYKRASLAAWLAKQNNIEPSKLQIGQEITLPEPP